MHLRNAQRSLIVAVCTGLALLAGSPAQAQSRDNAASSFFTLQEENSTISTSGLKDRFYTNGLRAGYVSPERTDWMLSNIANTLWGARNVRVAFDVTQQIYTPYATHTANPPATDEPYAGVLLANLAAVQDAMNTRSSVGLNLGIVGPSAYGEQVQNGFHDLIGQGHNLGWSKQLHDEPVFAVNAARVWRYAVADLGGLEADALPAAGVTGGTLRSAAEAGLMVRVGHGLQNDFGPSRMRALSGGDVFSSSGELGWYAFAGVKGDAVLNDVTLGGNNFRASPSVRIRPLVGEVNFGLVVLGDGFRVSYMQVVQTQTFKTQKGAAHEVGSLVLTVLF